MVNDNYSSPWKILIVAARRGEEIMKGLGAPGEGVRPTGTAWRVVGRELPARAREAAPGADPLLKPWRAEGALPDGGAGPPAANCG